MENEGHVLFAPGCIINSGETPGKVMEIDQLSAQVVFEVTLTPPIPFFNVTFHNV